MSTPRWYKQAIARVQTGAARPTSGPKRAAIDRAEDLLAKALDVAEGALEAMTQTVVVKGGGRTRCLTQPDWKSRLFAVKIITEIAGISGSRRPAEVPEPPTFEVSDPILVNGATSTDGESGANVDVTSPRTPLLDAIAAGNAAPPAHPEPSASDDPLSIRQLAQAGH